MYKKTKIKFYKMMNNNPLKIEDKIKELPEMPLRTYLKAVIEAGRYAEKKIPAGENSGPFQFRLEKIKELINKIVDQYLFLESSNENGHWQLKALNEAEEAACDAVRYLLKAGS